MDGPSQQQCLGRASEWKTITRHDTPHQTTAIGQYYLLGCISYVLLYGLCPEQRGNMLLRVRRSGWVGFLCRLCRRIPRLCVFVLLRLSIVLHHLVIE